MGRIFENVKPRFSDEDFQMVGFEPRLYRRKDIVLYNSYKKDGTGVMSNFYPCQIEYEGKIFNSAEQLLFYKDATKWGDCYEEQFDILMEIMNCECGRDVKNNYKVKRFDKKIDERKESVLGKRGALIDGWENCYECMKLKYRDCPEFREVLKKYSDKIIVEDSFWGDNFAGCLWDNSFGMYKGLNACGRAMMRVRREGLEEENKMVKEMEMACVGA